MSKIEVDQITQQSGSTLTVGGGACKTATVDATTVTIGRSGGTVSLASGATQSGFGRSGSVNWETTPKTAGFTAANGEGYFINTAGGVVTVTLPGSPSAGNIVAVSDYNGTAGSNPITIGRNGSNINGGASDMVISKPNSAVVLVYVDGTTGWQLVTTASTSDITNPFPSATGGTITTSGDFKIHTFTGPGTFTVLNSGCSGNNEVEYLVVAGGGGGGTRAAGGAGAGGFRFFGECIAAPYPASPLVAPAAIPISAQAYPITVGAGGTGRAPSGAEVPGNKGSNSIFSTITSTGGGGGKGGCAPYAPESPFGDGGSGGGAGPGGNAALNTGGAGNSPPVSPAQGTNGGPSGVNYNGGGGGGATQAGQSAGPTPGNGTAGGGYGGNGGGFPPAHFGPSGVTCGSFKYYAGGGGGGSWPSIPGPGGAGGKGGGAAGVNAGDAPSYSGPRIANSGTANSGGGGAGGGGGDIGPSPTGPAIVGGTGGSGIVVIRYKFQ